MIEREHGTIRFEIVEHIGVLNTSPTGWNKEFNVVKWNDKSEKYDIRDWSPGHERMSRGITLYGDELKKLVELCADMFDASSADGPEEKQASPAQTADKIAGEEIPF